MTYRGIVVAGIATRLRKERKAKKMTLRGLAESAHVSHSFICDIEKERALPSLDTLKAIAAALGVPVDYLIGTEEDKEWITHLTPELQEWIKNPANLAYLQTVKSAAEDGATPEDLATFVGLLRQVKDHYQKD